MLVTLIILATAVFFFVTAKIRSDIVALCALVALILFNILTPEEALSGFASSIVIMMIGLFVVSGAILQTGLAKMISRKILVLAGESQVKLFLLIMLVTSSIGAFVSNTGTVALMLPIIVSLAMSANISPSRFLMPLAYASSMGGMMTLIGTPPNLVINSTLIAAGYEGLAFFSFLPVGLICVALGMLLLFPLSRLLLSKDKGVKSKERKGKSLRDLAAEYQLSSNLFRVRAGPDSLLANKKLQELEIRHKYNINILEIRRKLNKANPFRKTFNQKIVSPETIIKADDILYILGSFGQVRVFAKENNLKLIDAQETEESVPTFSGKLRFDEIGIAEVVLMSNSGLVNKTVEHSGFREKFRLNILGIQRKDQYLLHDLKDEKMQAGDVLLVQGAWASISLLDKDQTQCVVVGQPLAEASKLTLDHKAPLAAIIMIAMVVCMAFDIIPAVAAVMLAAILMVLTGCLRNIEETYGTINWESVVLIGAMLPVSMAIEKTGAAAIVSHGLVSGLGSYGPIVLLAGIYFATSLFTMFISNTATAVLFAPIALQAAIETGVSPYPFLFAVTVAASMCFASPFSTPPNALVMSAGRYTFKDYIRVGLPLQIIFGIVMVFVLPALFPF